MCRRDQRLALVEPAELFVPLAIGAAMKLAIDTALRRAFRGIVPAARGALIAPC